MERSIIGSSSILRTSVSRLIGYEWCIAVYFGTFPWTLKVTFKLLIPFESAVVSCNFPSMRDLRETSNVKKKKKLDLRYTFSEVKYIKVLRKYEINYVCPLR